MYISNKNLKMKKIIRTGISTGNKKMTEKFLIWNLPRGITCPYKTEKCFQYCYAKKAERFYPSVLPSRLKNFEESKKDNFIENMENKIKSYFSPNKKTKYPYFRIHESGDFYNENYFEKWLSIIKKFPNLKFLAFTKSIFVKKYINELPKNFNLYYSVAEDTDEKNIIWELPLAFAGNYNSSLVKNAFECSGSCNNCLYCFNDKKNVYFKIH